MENIIGSRLRTLRESKDWLQKDVAEKLGLSTSGYGYYETGKRSPDSQMLKKICDLYNVDADYILGRTDYKRDPNMTMAFNTLSTEGLDEDDIEMIKGIINKLKKKNAE